MSSNQQSFACVFDSSHKLESKQRLIIHMNKCKSIAKQGYECCRYNAIHWVKFGQLEDHQANCKDNKPAQKSFSNILPNEISDYKFSVPFEIDQSAIMDAKQIIQEIDRKDKKNEKNQKVFKKKQRQMKPTDQKSKLWQQPDFEKFVISQGYKKSQKKGMKKEDFLFFENDISSCY